MRIALIDIGSNTIRLVVYDGDKEIENTADHAGLVAEVSEGKITPAGISKLTTALVSMKKRAIELGSEKIYAFATASLRDIEDKEGLISFIEETSGIKIEIISGEAEAMYDYYGIRSIYNEKNGVAFDLGGGSCQIILFRYGTVREFLSMPIGSLRLYSDIVSDILPDDEEINRIARVVRKNLSNMPLVKNEGFKKIYAMGGAAHALAAISQKCFGADGKTLGRELLLKICAMSAAEIQAVEPKRVKTIVPAALTIMEIMDYVQAEEILVTPAGVRDGVLNYVREMQ